MYRAYEIFEVLPDGSTVRRTAVFGLEFAKLTLESLSERTPNECFVTDEKTHQVVAQMNVPPAKRTIKRIFQISYDEQAGLRRAELLRGRGYNVLSALGNDAAKALLCSIQPYDLFIVGHAAPKESRKEMVDWLKTKYPNVKILALNPPDQQMSSADYNAMLNGPESWLSFVVDRLGNDRSVR